MKKHVLLGSVLLAAVSAFSQSGKVIQTGMINTKMLAEIKFGPENPNPVANTNPVKPISSPPKSGSKTSSITWQNLSASMNIYGVIISYCKPLQWNDELDAVSFVHRKSPSYVFSPLPASTAATGAMVAEISTDCGATWDSTALFSDDNFWGRYPGGAIYNPPSNTDISNAYIVGAGPTTGAGSVTWIGNFYASKQLGSANYNNVPSTVPNAQQVMATTPPFAPGVPSRHDFSAYGFSATDDGKMRVLAGISGAASDTAVMLMTGTFNNGVFDWTGQVFDPPTTVDSNGDENWVSRPIMAWNEQGNIGYVVIMGSRLGATGSNIGFQPIVYKTTNSGSTWSLENGVNFNSGAFDDVKAKLWSVNTDTNLVVPNFYWIEGVDCSVDMHGKLHVFTSLVGHPSNHPDSLSYISQWTTERYRWPHAPIVDNGPAVHPYLWDFIYDGTSTTTPTWSHMLIDSMSTEGPQAGTTAAGYQDNPWDADPSNSNSKVRVDARLQMSRTPDGKHLMYTWSESDTAYTDNQKKWNNLPNIKARLYDVENDYFSETEIDMTVDAQGDVANHAMYQFVSPKFKLVSKTSTSIEVDLPATCSNSSPYSQLTRNLHWYTCANMSFARPNTVGVKDNQGNSSDKSTLYPNPAKNSTSVKVNLTTASNLQIEVLNTLGQIVKITKGQGQVGDNTLTVDLTGLASGVYLVNIKVNNLSSTKKLIVE